MNNQRKFEKVYGNEKSHPDFDIVTKGDENVFIVSQGARSGTVFTDPELYDHFTDAHLFIRAKDDTVIRNIQSLQPELKRRANITARIRGCGLHQFIDAYENKYGRTTPLTSDST